MEDIKIHATKIEQAVLEGLRNAVRESLGTSYGSGAQFKQAVADAMKANEPKFKVLIDQAISKVITSPEFERVLLAEIVGGMKNKFNGAFDSVWRNAGRKAAEDLKTVEQISEMLRSGKLLAVAQNLLQKEAQ